MKSAITSKFQTTIPKAIRKSLKLSIHDTLDWTVDKGRVIVTPVKKPFLDYRNSFKTGRGNISEDIAAAREKRAKKFE